MGNLRKILNKLISIQKKVCVTLLILMLFINFAQVLLRYVFNKPFSWSEEIILTMLVWFGFICMSIDIGNDSHVAITGVYDKLSKPLKKVADLIRHGLLTIFFALMIKYGHQLLNISMRKKMPATGLSQGWQSAPLLIGGIIMFFFSLVNLLSVFFKEKDISEKKVVE